MNVLLIIKSYSSEETEKINCKTIELQIKKTSENRLVTDVR